MKDIEKAEKILEEGATCVLVKDGFVLISRKNGIGPMLDFLGAGIPLEGFCAADKIVGKAAAMLFVRAGIRQVYAEVLSLAGAEYLEKNGIPFRCGKTAEYIVNRTGDGMCPMELTVRELEDTAHAYCALCAKREELKRGLEI